jgi:hypothetical protein
MYYHLLYVLFYLIALTIQLQNPLGINDQSPFDRDFDALASQTLEHWRMPGLAIAAIDGNKTFSKVCNFVLKM